MKEITEATARFIEEAIKEFGIIDPKAIDAIRQAAFRAAGYAEAAILNTAEKYMDSRRAQTLRQIVFEKEKE